MSHQYDKVKVQVVSTGPSLAFFKREDIEDGDIRVWTDKDEWPVGSPLKRRNLSLIH